MNKQYRYELKFTLNKVDAAMLKKQLALVCELDAHSVSEEYSYDIRSLYFDDPIGSAYMDKVNGEMIREKFRIRIYNLSSEIIKLECKHKDYNMTYKEEEDISLDTYNHIVKGEFDRIDNPGELLYRFMFESRLKGLKPAVIVDYRRLAFTYPVSEVRITFDEEIRSGRFNYDLFDKDLDSYKVIDNDLVEIEVKCNDFIPDHIIAVINSIPKCRMAISKFALSYSVK